MDAQENARIEEIRSLSESSRSLILFVVVCSSSSCELSLRSTSSFIVSIIRPPFAVSSSIPLARKPATVSPDCTKSSGAISSGGTTSTNESPSMPLVRMT